MSFSPGRSDSDAYRHRNEGIGVLPERNPDLTSCLVLVRSERRLLWFPWWNLTETPIVRRRTFAERTPTGELRYWQIQGGPEGLPTPFDVQVYRALEWKALEGVDNPDREIGREILLSLRDVCERSCLKESVSLEPAFHRALRRLSEVRIAGPLPSVTANPRRSPSISGAIVRVSSLPRAHRSTRVFQTDYQVLLDSSFLRSVQRRDLTPLCWEAWTAVSPGLSRRLLEVLSCAFGDRPGSSVLMESGMLAQFLGMADVPTPVMTRKLRAAHAELATAGFLADAPKMETGKGLVYEPGAGARSLACRTGRLKPRRPELTPTENGSALSWIEDRTEERVRA